MFVFGHLYAPGPFFSMAYLRQITLNRPSTVHLPPKHLQTCLLVPVLCCCGTRRILPTRCYTRHSPTGHTPVVTSKQVPTDRTGRRAACSLAAEVLWVARRSCGAPRAMESLIPVSGGRRACFPSTRIRANPRLALRLLRDLSQ